jgi:hypothetical protein
MPNEKQAEALLNATCDFQGESNKAREVTRNEFRKNETNEQNILRIIVDGLLSMLAMKTTAKVENTDEGISYQIGLSASFIRTHYITLDHILNGDLIEAVTLTRKQLESLTRMFELDSKPLAKLSGKVPNISNNRNKNVGKLYGEMSEIAHFASPRVAELLHVLEDGPFVGPSLYPRYSEQSHAISDTEYFTAIYFLGWFVEKLTEWYPKENFSEEKQLIGEAIVLALRCGVIRYSEEK